ncbi:MAG: aldehyde ferredoxin oxidoreductase N-terminal domain-containing protein [Pseudomonadota bacterium]
MRGQPVLQIDLSDGTHRLDEVEQGPCFVGAMDYFCSSKSLEALTVLGNGPLEGSCVPGTSDLVMATWSPLWDGLYSATMSGAALPWDGLVALRGSTDQTSVLLLTNTKGSMDVRLIPLDPEPIWEGNDFGKGTFALLGHLAQVYGTEHTTVQVLVIGPAAAKSRYGALLNMPIEQGKLGSAKNWIRRGGFGSHIFGAHGLCALVFCTDRKIGEQKKRSMDESLSDTGFIPKMSLSQLEAATSYNFNSQLIAWGPHPMEMLAVGRRGLWFNNTSIYWTAEQRDRFYCEVVRPYLLNPLMSDSGTVKHQTCNVPCPVECKTLVDGLFADPEPIAALGTQLGIVSLASLEKLIVHCESMGFDSLSLGSILGWLMERLHRRLLQPGAVEVADYPMWDISKFDPVGDSEHNANLVMKLVDGLLSSSWGVPLRAGLRAAAQSADKMSASLAAYLPHGKRGEAAMYPKWVLGALAPMPIAGERHGYYEEGFLAPGVLGQKCGERMIAEIMLQNFGVCRLHRGWAESAVPEMVNLCFEQVTDWLARHRRLAVQIYRRSQPCFWETERTIDMVEKLLENCQQEMIADSKLDFWARRFRRDRASAARSFWSEILGGMSQYLTQ